MSNVTFINKLADLPLQLGNKGNLSLEDRKKDDLYVINSRLDFSKRSDVYDAIRTEVSVTQTQEIIGLVNENTQQGLPDEYAVLAKSPIVRCKAVGPVDHFEPRQRWRGTVVGVDTDTFEANLIPLLGQGGDQYAEIYVSEVDEEDRGLIEVGATFYWNIGYLRRPSGLSRSSFIRFQRLTVWAKSDIRAAETKAQERLALFDAIQ
jgi:hypothetical protein